ncbi:MAG: alkaline shock response membrane anchor protein AmaP [Candidatus Omnitrophica bacterium]|nr:alkaline shock response membrane anchor protein AmaP [Candidatus Omnitrophota bacterium]
MRFLSQLFRLLGALFFLLTGVVLLILAARLLSIDDLNVLLSALYDSTKTRLLLGAIGGAILLATVTFARVIILQIQRERTIAFHNPDGEVTVALDAIEDFIKRVGSDLNGIKEIKPYVRATRSGIVVTVRGTLWADTHIPEATERLQHVVRSHIHDILGVEEPITIHVHIGKVAQRPTKKEKATEKESVQDLEFENF